MYEDTPQPPSIFANHVLNQFVQHLFGDELVIEPQDYLSMRVAFRQCGGQWQLVVAGDTQQLDILKRVVTAWGEMPDRKNVSDTFV